jgi:16S rRNA (adenine1518-N6/adenine1519-N6)-dimethyltransferase
VSQKFRAKKSLGQNFLQDKNIARKIVDSLSISKEDRVLEIGPGQGALTEFIRLSEPRELMLLEKDYNLAPELEMKFPEAEVVQADALEFDWTSLEKDRKWKIVGNLPYNVASKLIWDIVSLSGVDMCVFMVQHEVAQRLTASCGNRQYGGLGAWVQSFCETKYLFKVPPSVFVPRPKIDSGVVRFISLPENKKPENPSGLAMLIRFCFQKRRKQLGNILKSYISSDIEEWFESEGLKLSDRPEALSPLQFQGLYNCVKNDFSLDL